MPATDPLSRHSSWLSVNAPRSGPISALSQIVGIPFVEEFYIRTPTSGVEDGDSRQFPIIAAQAVSEYAGSGTNSFIVVPELTVQEASLSEGAAERRRQLPSNDGVRSSDLIVSGAVNRGLRVLPGGRILGREGGSFRVPRNVSFSGITRIESDDIMRSHSDDSDVAVSGASVPLSELAKIGRIGEKLTAEDRKNLYQAFLGAISLGVQYFPFGDKKYRYSVIRLSGNHSSTYSRGRVLVVTNQEWVTIVKDPHKPNRWVAVETDSTLYAELARKCSVLGLKHTVNDGGDSGTLRPIRSIRSMHGGHIKTHSPKYYALRWFLKLMEAGENISESEKALIRGRVKNIFGYVFSLGDDEARLFIKTYFSDYGNTCADNAMEGLEQAEFAISMKGSDEQTVFEAFLNKLKSEFVVGMSAVELFEDSASGSVISKPRAIGWGESIETKIYLTLLLGEVIDMGFNGHAMLYPKCAYRPRADLAYRFFIQGFNGDYVLESLPLMQAFKEYACNCYVQKNSAHFSSVILDDCTQELVKKGKLGIDKARFYASLEQAAQKAGFSEDAKDGGGAFYDEIDRLKTQIAHNYTVKMLDTHYRFRQ